jgi:hypothetical protein
MSMRNNSSYLSCIIDGAGDKEYRTLFDTSRLLWRWALQYLRQTPVESIDQAINLFEQHKITPQ